MKEMRFILFTFIATFCIAFTSCNSDDDVYNTEPENELKIVGGTPANPSVGAPVGYSLIYLQPYGSVYMWNYVQIKAEGLGLKWYDTPAMSPNSGRNRTVLINDASMFRYYFRGTLPAVDFTRCSVIATQFYSTYVLSGDSQYIAKYPIINGNGILMDIRDNYTGAGLCAITHPTVMIIIPKVPNGTPINTRIQKGQQAIYF